jgi:hypothetical protein
MKNAIRLVVLAVLGYVVYEAIEGYFRNRRRSGGPVSTVQASPRPMGRVPGAAMTGPGQGVVERTLDETGESTATRVGRGVVSRGG